MKGYIPCNSKGESITTDINSKILPLPCKIVPLVYGLIYNWDKNAIELAQHYFPDDPCVAYWENGKISEPHKINEIQN